MSFAQVSHTAVLAYLTSPNNFFVVPFFVFTWSFSSLHVFAECLFLLPLTLCCLLCPANFFHSPLLSAGDFFTFHGHDTFHVHGSFQAECPFPLKIPLWLLCFSKTEALRLKMRPNEGSTSASFLKSAILYKFVKCHSPSYQAAGCPGRAAPCSCVIWTLSGTKAHGTGSTRYSKIGLQLGRMQTTRWQLRRIFVTGKGGLIDANL